MSRDKEPEVSYLDLPKKAHQLGDLLTFAEWLQSTGRRPIEPGSEYETAVWLNHDQRRCVIYHDQYGRLSWTRLAAEDFREYLRSQSPLPANDG